MNITELKELAEKATPGPWKHRNGRIFQLDYETLTIANVARAFDGDYSPANGELLAAANPAAILELITQLEDAQGEIRALRDTGAGLVERVKELEKGLTKIKNWKARDGSILDGPKDFARALLEKKE